MTDRPAVLLRRLGAVVLATTTALTTAALPLAGPARADDVPAPVPVAAVPAALSATDLMVQANLAVRSLDPALGLDLAGTVTDATTGVALWSQDPAEAQIPASNTKILTAVDALESFGPTHRFTTKVMTGTAPRRVVLVGGGDPSLTTRQLGRMARVVAASYLAQGITRVRVLVDDSLFPAPTSAPGWRASYQIRDVSPVRALVVDQHRRWDTSLDAGAVFAAKLRRFGLVLIKRPVAHTIVPATATLLAANQGADVGTQVHAMLQESDNDIAEGLHRLVALQTGFPATWEGAQAARVAALGRLGVTITTPVYDGSGLSRLDRLTPDEIVAVLGRIFDPAHPNLAGLQAGALPVAGVSGTLGPRYRRYVTAPASCAAGLIEAKTGSLSGVIALSGFARGADGQVKFFSFLLNGVPATLSTRRAVDLLATTITGCY